MGRRLHFYAFSADRWLNSVGNATPQRIARLEEIAMSRATNPSEEARSFGVRGAAILSGRERPIGDVEEDLLHMWLARALVMVDQQPEPAPDCATPVGGTFWYALSQAFCFRDAEIDGQPLAPGPARRIGRYLYAGRPLFGSVRESKPGELGRHDLYGWLSREDDVPLLAGIIASDAWAAYVRPRRYKQKEVPAFMTARQAALEWVEGCVDAERDIFFSSFPLAPGMF